MTNIEKKTYTVIADALIPIKVKYIVEAVDEKEAAELIKKGKFKDISIDKPRVKPQHLLQIAVFLGNTVHKLLSVRLR